MKSALTRWAFSVAFVLIVSAVGISTTELLGDDYDRTSLGRLVHGDDSVTVTRTA